MTPDALNGLLITIHQAELSSDGDAEAALDRIEAAAEAEPGNQAVAQAFDAVYRRVQLERGLPSIVAGVRREALVRWDDFSSTWTGTRVQDGVHVMVRTTDAHSDPRRRRQLDRMSRAMGMSGRGGALVAPLHGQPLGSVAAGDPALARRLTTGLIALQQRAAPTPPLVSSELRVDGDQVTVVCLTAGDDPRVGVGCLSKVLLPEGDGPMVDLLTGLAEHPVGPPAAAVLVSKALGRELAGMRHHLLARWTASTQNLRLERLATMVARLRDALPPPRGRAAAGVDFEGTVLTVASTESQVAFGPDFAMEQIWSEADGIEPVLCRKLLRTQAAAPPNPRLSKQVGGDDAFNGAIGRWVAASLRLRTMSLLLEQQLSS